MAQKCTVLVDGSIWDIDWITHEGRPWLVNEWIPSPDGKSMRPRRIISLAIAPGYSIQAGKELLGLFQKPLLTERLLTQGIPPAGLEKVFEVREEPEIWLPNPKYSH